MDLPLRNYIFVFTGELSIDRDLAKNRVILLGAAVRTAITSKTTHLVAGSNPGPAKIEKAKNFNIQIIDENSFNNLVAFRDSGDNEGSGILGNRTEMRENRTEMRENRIEMRETENSTLKTQKTLQKSWVEKHRPKKRAELVGNPTAIEQIRQFVRGKSAHSAALVSGPPGTGKTTAVHAICREERTEPIEFNASDLRNKSKIASVFSGALESGVIGSFLRTAGSKDRGNSRGNNDIESKNDIRRINDIKNIKNINESINNGRKPVIVMDEVDGMTSDRGGIAELVSLIKSGKAKFICICNDRTHPKMQTLARHCEEIRFRTLGTESIAPRIREILEIEGCSVPENVLNAVVAKGKGDMRHILNSLQGLCARQRIDLEKLALSEGKKRAADGPFEIAAEIFQNKTVQEKISLYFDDHQLIPLFVHENYAKCTFQNLGRFSKSADSISFADLLDARIHGTSQEWALMPFHAFFSCVYPVHGVFLRARIDFPQFLGKLSRLKKNTRLTREFLYGSAVSSNSHDSLLYVFPLIWAYYRHYLESGDIKSCVDLINDVSVSKEDIENIGEIMGEKIAVPAKVRAALTRECKKSCKGKEKRVEDENEDD